MEEGEDEYGSVDENANERRGGRVGGSVDENESESVYEMVDEDASEDGDAGSMREDEVRTQMWEQE